jgi:hypothetical protein
VNQTQEEDHPSASRDDAKNSVGASGHSARPDANEDQALAAIQRADITASELATIARDAAALKSRKVNLALTTHPRTPRHTAIPLLRRMFTFDLMQVTLIPRVAADLKRVAEDQILVRLESMSAGEKMSLARRASGRVAAALLQDSDDRVITAALDNTRLTEFLVAAALANDRAPQALFEITSGHPKWSQRREVQIALLRSEKTPLEHAREFAKNFSGPVLREIVPDARIAELA